MIIAIILTILSMNCESWNQKCNENAWTLESMSNAKNQFNYNISCECLNDIYQDSSCYYNGWIYCDYIESCTVTFQNDGNVVLKNIKGRRNGKPWTDFSSNWTIKDGLIFIVGYDFPFKLKKDILNF